MYRVTPLHLDIMVEVISSSSAHLYLGTQTIPGLLQGLHCWQYVEFIGISPLAFYICDAQKMNAV